MLGFVQTPQIAHWIVEGLVSDVLCASNTLCNCFKSLLGCWKLYTQVAGQSGQKTSESVEFKAPGPVCSCASFLLQMGLQPFDPFIGDQKQHQDT